MYDFVWIGGCLALSRLAGWFDTWIVDGIANALSVITVQLARFAGWVIDLHGVDGIVNGLSRTAQDTGNVLRQLQTGRVRHYVLWAAVAATVLIVGALVLVSQPAGAAWSPELLRVTDTL